MRSLFLKIIIFTAFLSVFPFGSSNAEINSTLLLKKEIDKSLQNSCLKGNGAGIKVLSLTRGDILYQRNSGKTLLPASNIKILTSAVALKELGGDYQFLTTVSTDGDLKHGVIKGNLYLKGYGDPRLVSEELWMIVKSMRNQGIKRIYGDIIADDTFFDDQIIGAGVAKNAGPEPYNARISALSLNFNTVTVYVDMALKKGVRPRVRIDPQTKYIKISNNAKTVFKGKHKKLIVGRVIGKGYDTVVVKGAISTPRFYTYIAVSDPTLYTATVFKEFLGKEGIRVSGEVLIGKEPENLNKLVIHKSRPLSLIIQDMNKISNNFIAEQVLKTAGAEKSGVPGTIKKGLKLVSRFMKSLGYSPSSYTMVDGSGLSRKNRLSPDQIVDILKSMHDDFSLRPEFASSLGIMGIDGSLKKRLNGLTKKRFIRAKTGTLNGANSLSGYIGAEGGEELAFSILMNSKKCSWNKVTKIQNRIVTRLVNFSRPK